MKPIVQEDLRAIVTTASTPCISIYMPTHRAQDNQQDPIRLKNLLGKARDQLIARGMRSSEARDMLQPVSRMLDDSQLWRDVQSGLAVFCAPGTFLQYRLSTQCPELAIVTEHFHLKPLLPLFMGYETFYVLALNLKDTRLIQGTRNLFQEIELRGALSNLNDIMETYVMEEYVSFHAYGIAGGGGRPAAVMHASGAMSDDAVRKKYIREYFVQLDRAVARILNAGRQGLILAGVKYLCALYREVNTYGNLMQEEITPGPQVQPRQLYQEGLKIIERHRSDNLKQAIARYQSALGSSLAISDIERIVPASYRGQVDMLLVSQAQQAWGRFDPSSEEVVIHQTRQANDEDLMDLAATYTLMHGGNAYVVPAGETTAPAAILRY